MHDAMNSLPFFENPFHLDSIWCLQEGMPAVAWRQQRQVVLGGEGPPMKRKINFSRTNSFSRRARIEKRSMVILQTDILSYLGQQSLLKTSGL